MGQFFAFEVRHPDEPAVSGFGVVVGSWEIWGVVSM